MADPADIPGAVAKKMAEADRLILELTGIRIEDVTAGSAVCSMAVREDMVNSHAYCHGGLVFTLADTAFAYACSSGNRASVTLSANIAFIQPAKLGDTLTASATLISEGGRTGVCEVNVTNQDGDKIARYQGTCYRMRDPVV